MHSPHPPKHAQVLIVGGGPSGSYAAACLAREGFHVVVIEAAAFPRYHIGESLLPSVRHHLRFIGAEEKVDSYGFFKKPGAAIKFNQFKSEAYTDFVAMGPNNYSWNVTRSEFDKLLLDHAETTGAQVFQSTKVTSLDFSGERPVSAQWAHGPSSRRGIITFDYLIDASGRAGLMSSRYLKNRRFNENLKNVAMWAYWRDTDVYAPGTTAEGAIYTEALSDESGWAWFIPLRKGFTSVGIVRHQATYSQPVQPDGPSLRSSQTTPLTGSQDGGPTSSADFSSHGPSTHSLSAEQRYIKALDLVPGVNQLLGFKGKMVRGEADLAAVRTASDYSYSASSYAGENYRIVGDAAAFIDPFFSSGVHLAMTGGLSAAASIAASIRGDCPESHAAEWHTQRVCVSYTRFLVVVLSAYKQIRAQSKDVLCDVGEDNFNKAFHFLRPVIQGNADLGPRLSEDEVQNALDFCIGLFKPINRGVARQLRKHLEGLDLEPFLAHCLEESAAKDDASGKQTKQDNVVAVPSFLGKPEPVGCSPPTTPVVPGKLSFENAAALMDPNAPVLPVKEIQNIARNPTLLPALENGSTVEVEVEVERILEKVNARRLIHREHSGLHSLEEETLGAGYRMRLERGRLGLVQGKAVD